MKKLLHHAYHLRYASQDREFDSKELFVFGLKTTLLNQTSHLLPAHLISAYGQGVINTCMRIVEIVKPKTPDQLRIDQLSTASKRAKDAVKHERLRQKTQRAQQVLKSLQNPGLKAPA
jgi:hypothetical protein